MIWNNADRMSRDRRLYEARMAGASWMEIIDAYRVSWTQARRIVRKMQKQVKAEQAIERRRNA